VENCRGENRIPNTDGCWGAEPCAVRVTGWRSLG